MLTREQRTGYWNPFRSNHEALLAQRTEDVADNLVLLAQDLVATAHPAASNVSRPRQSLVLVCIRRSHPLPTAPAACSWAVGHPTRHGGMLPQVLIMFGDDHRWEDAQTTMAGLEDAIAAINAQSARTGVRAQFSTPARFAAALHEEQIEFPARPAQWDMLPLIGDEMGAPWSGFFTSRPGFKARSSGPSTPLASRSLRARARFTPAFESWLTLPRR